MRFKINFGIATCNFFNYYTNTFTVKYCRQAFPKSTSVVIVISRDSQTHSWVLWKYPEIQFVCIVNNQQVPAPTEGRNNRIDIRETRVPPVWKEARSHLFQVYSTSPNQRGLHPVCPLLGDLLKPLGRHSSVLTPCVLPVLSYKYLPSEHRYC